MKKFNPEEPIGEALNDAKKGEVVTVELTENGVAYMIENHPAMVLSVLIQMGKGNNYDRSVN